MRTVSSKSARRHRRTRVSGPPLSPLRCDCLRPLSVRTHAEPSDRATFRRPRPLPPTLLRPWVRPPPHPPPPTRPAHHRASRPPVRTTRATTRLAPRSSPVSGLSTRRPTCTPRFRPPSPPPHRSTPRHPHNRSTPRLPRSLSTRKRLSIRLRPTVAPLRTPTRRPTLTLATLVARCVPYLRPFAWCSPALDAHHRRCRWPFRSRRRCRVASVRPARSSAARASVSLAPRAASGRRLSGAPAVLVV